MYERWHGLEAEPTDEDRANEFYERGRGYNHGLEGIEPLTKELFMEDYEVGRGSSGIKASSRPTKIVSTSPS